MRRPLPGRPRPGLSGVCLFSRTCSPHGSSPIRPEPTASQPRPPGSQPPAAPPPGLQTILASHCYHPFSVSSSSLPVIQGSPCGPYIRITRGGSDSPSLGRAWASASLKVPPGVSAVPTLGPLTELLLLLTPWLGSRLPWEAVPNCPPLPVWAACPSSELKVPWDL